MVSLLLSIGYSCRREGDGDDGLGRDSFVMRVFDGGGYFFLVGTGEMQEGGAGAGRGGRGGRFIMQLLCISIHT